MKGHRDYLIFISRAIILPSSGSYVFGIIALSHDRPNSWLVTTRTGYKVQVKSSCELQHFPSTIFLPFSQHSARGINGTPQEPASVFFPGLFHMD